MLNEKQFIGGFVKKVKHAFRYTVAFTFVMNILMLFLPFYSLLIFDKVMTSHSMSTLTALTLIVTVAFLALSALNALRGIILGRIADWLDASVSPKLLEVSIARSALAPSSANSQLLRDVAVIKSFVTGQGLITILDAPWSPLFILVTFLIHPVLGLITVLGAILLIAFAIINEVQTKQPLEESNADSIKALANAETTVRNAEAIEAMGMMKNVLAQWSNHSLKIISAQKTANDRASIIGSISKFFRLMVQAALICAGAYFAIHHSLSMGALIAGPILAGRALAPFEAAIGVWKSFVMTRDAYHRINKSVAQLPDIRGTMELPEPKGEVRVEGVYFRPPHSDKFSLTNITFAVHPGDSVGIIGPSAAGKSTLAKLIVGVWMPTNGAIRLDNADVFKWSRDNIGQYIGYMPQSVELFPTTIRENIARLDGTATPDEVVEAAKLAGAHDMILRLPKGYDTVIGEGGVSPGQQQRIALARAFFRNPKLLVLDEPNSNLDGEGELALINSISKTKALGTTVFMVAHKPSVLSNIDKLLVLRDGALEMFGPRDAILAKLAERQSGKPGGAAQPPQQNITNKSSAAG